MKRCNTYPKRIDLCPCWSIFYLWPQMVNLLFLGPLGKSEYIAWDVPPLLLGCFVLDLSWAMRGVRSNTPRAAHPWGSGGRNGSVGGCWGKNSLQSLDQAQRVQVPSKEVPRPLFSPQKPSSGGTWTVWEGKQRDFCSTWCSTSKWFSHPEGLKTHTACDLGVNIVEFLVDSGTVGEPLSQAHFLAAGGGF